MSNAITMLTIDRSPSGVWSFDDPSRGLCAEPFVGNTNRVIDRHADGASRVDLTFSAAPFPSATLRLDLIAADAGGSYWRTSDCEDECWLCPALYRYFPEAPASIHIAFAPHPARRTREDRADAAIRGARMLAAYRGMRSGRATYADLLDDLVAAMHRDGMEAYDELRGAADRLVDGMVDGLAKDLRPVVILGPGPGARRVLGADGVWRDA